MPSYLSLKIAGGRTITVRESVAAIEAARSDQFVRLTIADNGNPIHVDRDAIAAYWPAPDFESA